MRILITGGAGFIGVNAAGAYLDHGAEVRILDNFARPGTEENLAWLRTKGGPLTVVRDDVRDFGAVRHAAADVDVILHLAAQTAVTTSVVEPREDFEVNALGTFNVLEAARARSRPPAVLLSSTNKVYGGMEEVDVVEEAARYRYRDAAAVVSELRPLDFHSPYGCSKGAADQYVHDYARIYGLRTVVFRQSCIYGPHQYGSEEQGWLAHFSIAAVLGKAVNIYGDGKQVRDALYVDDLVAAYMAATAHLERTAGQIYNLGGGPQHTISLLELLALLEQSCGVTIPRSFHGWRPGDQRIYVSDVRRAAADFGWQPRTSVAAGVAQLVAWVRASRDRVVRVVGT
jgi:CDP-paratose 2-epimerase